MAICPHCLCLSMCVSVFKCTPWYSIIWVSAHSRGPLWHVLSLQQSPLRLRGVIRGREDLHSTGNTWAWMPSVEGKPYLKIRWQKYWRLGFQLTNLGRLGTTCNKAQLLSFLIFIRFLHFIVLWILCLHECMCAMYMLATLGGRKKAPDPLVLESRMVVNTMLEIEVGFSVKATNALNDWTLFLGSLMTFPWNTQNPKGWVVR